MTTHTTITRSLAELANRLVGLGVDRGLSRAVGVTAMPRDVSSSS